MCFSCCGRLESCILNVFWQGRRFCAPAPELVYAAADSQKVSACMKVFYGFGAAGLLWSSWWESVVSSMAEEDPEAHRLLTETAADREAARAEPEQAMPWRAFLRNGPMRALAYTHFCNNWCAFGHCCVSHVFLSTLFARQCSSSKWQLSRAMSATSHGSALRQRG